MDYTQILKKMMVEKNKHQIREIVDSEIFDNDIKSFLNNYTYICSDIIKIMKAFYFLELFSLKHDDFYLFVINKYILKEQYLDVLNKYQTVIKFIENLCSKENNNLSDRKSV